MYDVQYLKLVYFTKYVIVTCAGCLKGVNIFRVPVSIELFSVQNKFISITEHLQFYH